MTTEKENGTHVELVWVVRGKSDVLDAGLAAIHYLGHFSR